MTDHRAKAADLMAETAAMPDAVEHLLAAIHDLLVERLPEPQARNSTPEGARSGPETRSGSEATTDTLGSTEGRRTAHGRGLLDITEDE